MALRIGQYVTAGEIRNTTRNSVFGWIEFAPDYGIRLELTGNFKGPFAGKHVKFRVNKPENEQIAIENLPEFIQKMADIQIGMVGTVHLHERKIPTAPVDQLLVRSELGEPAPWDVKDCLYLEWFSQNGRVVAEIVAPDIQTLSGDSDVNESLKAEPLPDEGSKDQHQDAAGDDTDTLGPSITGIRIDDDGQVIAEEIQLEPDADSDPYELFDHDLERQISQSLSENANTAETTAQVDEFEPWVDDSSESSYTDSQPTKSWDEVIPGIDSKTKALYESWDEVYGGQKDEPISSLFDPPIQFPPIESITTDEQAEPYLQMIIARLAILSVAIDVCEHMTPLSAYRMLVNEILPIANIHPNLAATNIVQHYCTFEFCPECEAKFEAECDTGVSKDGQ